MIEITDDVLIHYGVKGMKWGERRAAKADRKEWLKKSYSSETANKAYQDGYKSFAPAAKAINNDPMFKGKNLNQDRKLRNQYDGVMNEVFNQHLAQASVNLTYNPKTERAVIYQFDRFSQMMKGTEVKKLKHAADAFEFLDFKATLNELGQIIEFDPIFPDLEQSAFVDNAADFIEHFGVKGMKWGQRKSDYSGATRKVNREASSDAREFARAKLFYGEGAGTRRKLIKAKVETKSKKDATYKAAFDHHFAQQDLGKHADKAKGERRRKDVRSKTAKTARGVNRAINGPFAPSIAVAGIGAALSTQRGQAFVSNLLKDR